MYGQPTAIVSQDDHAVAALGYGGSLQTLWDLGLNWIEDGLDLNWWMDLNGGWISTGLRMGLEQPSLHHTPSFLFSIQFLL